MASTTQAANTGRKNGFTHVCELSKCVVNAGALNLDFIYTGR